MNRFIWLAWLKTWLLPPGLLIILCLLSFLLFGKRVRFALPFFAIVIILFYLLSCARVSLWLNAPLLLQNAQTTQWQQAQAIVVLGAGRRYANHLAADQLNNTALARLTQAVILQQQTRLPMLLSGGRPLKEHDSEAELMQQQLQQVFHLSAQWLENKSRNTEENALFSAKLLQEKQIKRVILVTSAWHMYRAEHHFNHQGLQVLPYAVNYPYSPPGLLGWLPTLLGLEQSSNALHEYLALLVRH